MPPEKGPDGKFVKRGTTPDPETQSEPAKTQPGSPEVSAAESGAAEAEEPAELSNDQCPATDATGQRCLYVVHDIAYDHVFNLNNVPKPEPAPSADTVPVARVNDRGEIGTWWCGRCDNAQLLNNKAVCAKCGAIPSGI